jgi:hypothetical protein
MDNGDTSWRRSLEKASFCSCNFFARGTLGETLDPGFPDRTLATFLCCSSSGDSVFGDYTEWSRLKVERCFVLHGDFGGDVK